MSANPNVYLNDRTVLQTIARYEASALWQLPGSVHLLSAGLYRLADSNYELFEDLGITVLEVRKWARDNLPQLPNLPFPLPAHQPLNHEYQIEVSIDRTSVQQIRRPVRRHTPPNNHPGGTGFMREPEEWNQLSNLAFQEMITIMDEATRNLAERPLTEAMVRSVLLHILHHEDVQKCLTDLSDNAERWEEILGKN